MPFPIGLRHRFARIRTYAFATLAWPLLTFAGFQRIPGIRPVPDATWGATLSHGPSRLACDRRGNVYLALGDSLWIGTGGTAWDRVPARIRQSSSWLSPALAVGGDLLAWGEMISPDRGAHWRAAGTRHAASAMAIYEDGRILLGTSYDAVDLSVDSGATWKNTHFGRTFGSIEAIATTPKGWALAAPGADSLLASGDRGATWRGVKGGDPIEARFLAASPAGEERVFALGTRFARPEVHTLLPGPGDAIAVATRRPSAGFPDSAVTCFAASAGATAGDLRLWAGTWGQGVFLSRDGGATWTPSNEGLKDLHVEALAASGSGAVFALTKDGLYSDAVASGMRRSGPAARRGTGTYIGNGMALLFGNGSEVSNPSEPLFRADGRLAAPARLRGE
jgi:hypothetical protein